MAKVIDKLMVCTDCQHYVAFDGLPDDDTGELEARIDAHLDLAEGQQLVEGDSEHDIEFTWHACECCGSKLGGARHEFLILE